MDWLLDLLITTFFFPEQLFSRYWYLFVAPIAAGVILAIYRNNKLYVLGGIFLAAQILAILFIVSAVIAICCVRLNIG